MRTVSSAPSFCITTDPAGLSSRAQPTREEFAKTQNNLFNPNGIPLLSADAAMLETDFVVHWVKPRWAR